MENGLRKGRCYTLEEVKEILKNNYYGKLSYNN